MKPRAFLPTGLVLLSALALAAQGITLKRTPQVGDKATYKVVGTFQMQGTDLTVTSTSVEEITKVAEGLVTKKSVQTTSISVMGQNQDAPERTQFSTAKLDGTPVSNKSDEGESAQGLRFADIGMLQLPANPIQIGGTWTAEAKKDEKKDLPGYKIDYTLVGEEKVGAWDVYKITSKGAETEGDAPTKVEGTYWIEKSTGRMVRTVLNLTDALIGPAPVSGKLEVNLQP